MLGKSHRSDIYFTARVNRLALGGTALAMRVGRLPYFRFGIWVVVYLNALSIGQLPMRVITIFPFTTCTARRTVRLTLMPFRALRILQAC
jgi:hypothetical protein